MDFSKLKDKFKKRSSGNEVSDDNSSDASLLEKLQDKKNFPKIFLMLIIGYLIFDIATTQDPVEDGPTPITKNKKIAETNDFDQAEDDMPEIVKAKIQVDEIAKENAVPVEEEPNLETDTTQEEEPPVEATQEELPIESTQEAPQLDPQTQPPSMADEISDMQDDQPTQEPEPSEAISEVIEEQESIVSMGENEDKIAVPQSDSEKVTSYRELLSSIKIQPDINYDPPRYEFKGRGLVYNCEKSYWACVNEKNYMQCAQHQKNNTEKKIKISCATREVYFSMDDCAKGQLLKIHNGEKPVECNQ